DVFSGQNRRAGSDAADDGNAGLMLQSYAVRSARYHFDGTFARKRSQMLLGGVRRAKSHRFADFAARRGKAGFFGVVLDQFENLRLARGQGIHGLSLAVIIYS